MRSTQVIVNNLRKGDLAALSQFRELIIRKYKTQDAEKIFIYSAYELMLTDLNESDIKIAKLFNSRMEETAEFVDELVLKQDSAVFLSASQAALILKKTNTGLNSINKSDIYEKIGSAIDNNKEDIQALDQSQTFIIPENAVNEHALVDRSLNFFIFNNFGVDEKRLVDILMRYQHLLETKIIAAPNDPETIQRLDFVISALKSLSSDLEPKDKLEFFKHANEIIQKTTPHDPRERTFLDILKAMFSRLIHPESYTKSQEKQAEVVELYLFKQRYCDMMRQSDEGEKQSLSQSDEYDDKTAKP